MEYFLEIAILTGMKKESIAAVILIGLVLFISVWMLFNWNSLKETTLLQGPVGLGK